MTRCWLSEHHLAITTEGKVLPCTRYKKRHDAPIIHEQKINDIYNGKWINEIRYNLQQGEKLDACKKCWQQEEAGIPSMRQNYEAEWSSKLKSLEIAFSNHCNFACRHCSSFSSSKWLDDDIMLGNPVPPAKLMQPSLENYDNLDDIEFVKMLGGEPLLNKNHSKFLHKLTNIQNVLLEYTTNGSVFPSADVLDIWHKAKKVWIEVSLDDINERFEYFRTHSNFDIVIENCKKFESLQCEKTLGFHIVLNALNLPYIYDIIKYLQDNFPNWYIYVDKVVVPSWLKTSQWSKSFAQKQISKLETLPNTQQVIDTILQECKNNDTNLEEFFDVNSKLDKSRNTDMYQIHPILNSFR